MNAPAGNRLPGLERNPDFVRLWIGQTLSMFGSQVTLLALPLTAIFLQGVTPAEMGILGALHGLPFLLVGLFAGVWVDRVKRRPILIAADLGRALLLATIPLALLLGVLQIWQIYLVTFLVGLLTLFFDVAYRSALPSLVGREHLVEGNSKLELSRSSAEIGGPGLAGVLVQILSAPVAILVDSISFICSAVLVAFIKTPEALPGPASTKRKLLPDIRDGLRFVFANPLLRSLAACFATINLFSHMLEAVFVLYAVRVLGLDAFALGVIFGSGNVGFLVGALLSGPLIRRIGLGKAVAASVLLVGGGDLLLVLAGGPLPFIVAILIAAEFFFGAGMTLFSVNSVSLRQGLTPDHMQGRTNATVSFLGWGIAPLGALAGGILAQITDMRSTLLFAALGELASVLWVVLTPLIRLSEHPQPLTTDDRRLTTDD